MDMYMYAALYTLLNSFTQILDALCYIHQPRERIRFVHRDLKPSNIFFARGREESIKIGDFGLVKGNALIEPTGDCIYTVNECTTSRHSWDSYNYSTVTVHNNYGIAPSIAVCNHQISSAYYCWRNPWRQCPCICDEHYVSVVIWFNAWCSAMITPTLFRIYVYDIMSNTIMLHVMLSDVMPMSMVQGMHHLLIS